MKKSTAVLLALAVAIPPVLMSTAAASAGTAGTLSASTSTTSGPAVPRLTDDVVVQQFDGSTTPQWRYRTYPLDLRVASSVKVYAQWAWNTGAFFRIREVGASTWLASTSHHGSPFKDSFVLDLEAGSYEVQIVGDPIKNSSHHVKVTSTAYYQPTVVSGTTAPDSRYRKTPIVLDEASRLDVTGAWTSGTSGTIRVKDSTGYVLTSGTTTSTPGDGSVGIHLPAGEYVLEFVGDAKAAAEYELRADVSPTRLLALDTTAPAGTLPTSTTSSIGAASSPFSITSAGTTQVDGSWPAGVAGRLQVLNASGVAVASSATSTTGSASLVAALPRGYYRTVFTGVSTAVAGFSGTVSAPTSQQVTPRSYLMPTGDKYVFSSAKSVWIKDVSAAPLSANTVNQQANFVKQIQDYYGVVNLNYNDYNSPWEIVGGDQARVDVAFVDCQRKGYVPDVLFTAAPKAFVDVPIPADAVPAKGTDAALTVYSPDTDQLWEFWQAKKREDGSWQACWGGRIDGASGSAGWFPSYTGTSATGLASSAGAIGIEEAQRGEINHALAIVLPEPAKGFVWPARRSDGFSLDVNGIKEGTRLRLDPSVDVDALKLHPIAKMTAKAAQKYGFVVTDKAGSVAVITESGSAVKAKTGIDPWTALRTKPNATTPTPGYEIFKNFPWDKVQVVEEGWGQTS